MTIIVLRHRHALPESVSIGRLSTQLRGRTRQLRERTRQLREPTMELHKRDRYLDSLLSLALIGVMTYHVFGWAWLPILFPSMGVMFAVNGSLIAGALDRSPGSPWRVLRTRGVRLLPPVWLFGLVVVPVMLVADWTQSKAVGVPLSWQTLLFWVVPISDPPASMLGADWVTPLWYVRSYLWFLLLSPAVFWLFRHWPKRMMALPVTVVLLSALGLLPLDGRSGDVILSTAMFGACWMLGFAHHDNRLRSLPLAKVLVGGAALMALGLTWAFTHPDPVSAFDVANIPMANTLYCLGAALILLRLHSDLSWMDKRVTLDKLVIVITSRAMTIYLWANLAIFLSDPILHRWSVTANLDQDNAVGSVQMYLASWLILIGFVFMFGWCEDLAASRQPRINPWPRSKQQLATMRVRRVLTFPHPTWMADLTPRRLFIVTSCLLAAAAAASAAALSGTNTPGRTTTADAPSRNAVNPRQDTTPPANLGQGNGQRFQFEESLSKVKSAVLGSDKGVRPASVKVKVVKRPTVRTPVSAGAPSVSLSTGSAPVSTAGGRVARAAVPDPVPAAPVRAPVRAPAPAPAPVRAPAPVPVPAPVPPAPVPTTDVPPAPVPPAPVPTTDVPPAPVPTTDVPPADVPSADVPPTDVPPTDVPATDVPPTDVPQP